MAADPIPEDVRRFLLTFIEGFEHLQVLLVLRAHADQGFSPERVAGATGLPLDVAAAALRALQESDLIEVSGEASAPEWRHRRPAPEVDALIERVAEAHRERPVDVVKLMNANAIERVRTSAARTFARALVRGKKEG